MRVVWFGVQWTGKKLFFLASMIAVATAMLLLPYVVVAEGESYHGWFFIHGFHTDFGKYWHVVQFHLLHLVRGQIIPPLEAAVKGSLLQAARTEMAAAVPVTLKLLGTAFAASLILGLALGALLSALAPRWLRTPLWGATSVLYSLPDLIIAGFLDLAVLLVTMAHGGAGPTQGSPEWQHFYAPTIALTLIVLPYIARVTATAIDEISGQQYIRAAVARGVHPMWVLVKHVGKNVLIRVWTALPVVVSLLFSGGAVVEYMEEVHGVGRALILNVGPQAVDRYAGVVFLIPMLVVFTAVLALSEMGQRLLDPRIRMVGGTGASPVARRSGPVRISNLRGAVAGFAEWLRSLPGALRDWAIALPGRLRQAIRAFRDPVLLSGCLLVLGMAAVAALAPVIAPYDPAAKTPAIMTGGRILVPPFTPGPGHWLGTDDLGRDILSRIIFGTRYALLFALLAVPARFILAIPFGLLAAFRGGTWDRLIRWLGTLFTAVPQVLLPLALIPAVNQMYLDQPGRALFWGVLLVALPGAPRLAISVRQQAVEVMAQPFVEGAEAVGAGTGRVLFRYILPQMLPQLFTMLALEIPTVLTLTAMLGYFRANPGGAIFDTQTFRPIAPLVPEWGSLMESPLMLLLAGRWWMWAPFAALCVAVLSFNLLGEGLRRAWASRTGWKWQG